MLAAGGNGLLVAPTGSGKTLAAFLWAIDRCSVLPSDAPAGVRVLYVSPLKALVYDIERNLRAPLIGIQRAGERLGQSARDVRVDMRTGDTPSRDRAKQRRNPADILVTTPESLFLLLGSQARATLASVHTVIVDEIHVFASTKRGVHLALSLERLSELVARAAAEEQGGTFDRHATLVEPQRVGLSATVRPLDEVSRFLVGTRRKASIVDASEPARLELKVVVPVPDMEDPGRSPRSPRSPAAPSVQASDGSAMTARRRDELAAASGAGREAGKDASGGLGQQGGWRSTEGGIWPTIYPEIIELILAHRSTILFVNSRGLCERLAQRLNEMYAARVAEEVDEAAAEAGAGLDSELDVEFDSEFDSEVAGEFDGEPEAVADLVRTHHGSISHEQRREVEEALKGGQLRCIVATSSLELGIDMGAVDLVILVESPGSVARGLQRVGRAGHGVGEISQGVVFPKFKGDLLECAVVSKRMLEGTLEPLHLQQNPLDVLAQQIVAMVADRDRSTDEVMDLVRAAAPYAELSREALDSVLDMLSGRYPSDDFADLRPRIAWDRAQNLLSARRGAKMVSLLNAGTIPDRGLYSVYLGEDGPRLGELDEEMVYESRAGDVILLGATAWRVTDITRDRVIVVPAPGEPGRMPFWHGDGPGRPIELGRAIGEFLTEAEGHNQSDAERGTQSVVEWLRSTTPLGELAAANLASYLAEQREATGRLPSAKTLVVERFRDELGDWRVCLLTPFGSRVHAPWAMALQRLLGERAGYEVETMYTDDGVVLRFPDLEELPTVEDFLPDPDEVEDLVVDQVGSSALFATRFRENAARALLTPKRRGAERMPLWLQRLKSKTLLSAVRRFSNFPILLETYRECLRDVFDLPSLVEILRQVQRREIRVHEVETPSASPFARSLVYAYIAQYLYEQDAPMAERKAQALTLDRNLLRELLGQAELRELIDPEALAEVEAELQALASDRLARDLNEVDDLLRRLGDLSLAEVVARTVLDEDGQAQPTLVESWLEELSRQQRAGVVQVAGEVRWIAADDAARYRDALGVQPPRALPQALLETSEAPLESLLLRYARTHGPFTTQQLAARYGLLEAQVEPILKIAQDTGALMLGEIRPGGVQREWCEQGVLRRIKRRTLARLRGEVAAVSSTVMGRYLPKWQGLEPVVQPEAQERSRPQFVAGAPSPRGISKRRPSVARDQAQAPVRLRETIAQLEALPLSWAVLSSEILPARVPGFDASLLDTFAASGEVVWIGSGALGSKDGKVALFRREQAARLLRPRLPVPFREALLADDGAMSSRDALHGAAVDLGAPAVAEIPDLSALHGQVLAHLLQRGACFTIELQRLAAARSAAAAELDAVVWDLVWAGLLTNDTFLPLQALGGVTRSRAARPRGGSRSSASRSGRASRGASRGAGLAGGRWSLVDDLIFEPGTDTEWAHAMAGVLLERYGIVSREAALSEELAGGFEGIYSVLREMEDRGQVRRGYFVEGLSGRQFALAGAIERLRADRKDLETASDAANAVMVLSAIDPSQPYGSLLSWPERREPDGPGPRRVKGAWVILLGGEPVGFLESGKRSMVTFQRTLVEGGVEAVDAGLSEIMARLRRRSLRLTKIDGIDALLTPVGERLIGRGFEADGNGVSWRAD